MKPSRAITIYCGISGTGLFAVHEGESYVSHLTWDEMLGELAQITHPSIRKSRYGMNTPEGHAERDRLSRKRMDYNRGVDIAAMQRAALEEALRWLVRRGGPRHRALPLEQQTPEVQDAIRALRLSKPDADWMPE